MNLDKLKDPMFPWQPIEDIPASNPERIEIEVFNGREWVKKWMLIDTPEKQAQALRIAMEALEYLRDEPDNAKGLPEVVLKQIEEVLG